MNPFSSLLSQTAATKIVLEKDKVVAPVAPQAKASTTAISASNARKTPGKARPSSGSASAMKTAGTPRASILGNKQQQHNHHPKTTNKMSEITSLLMRVQVLTGGKIDANEMLKKLSSSVGEENHAVDANIVPSLQNQPSKGLTFASDGQQLSLPLSPQFSFDAHSSRVSDHWGWGADRGGSMHQQTRYSLGVSRFSLPGGSGGRLSSMRKSMNISFAPLREVATTAIAETPAVVVASSAAIGVGASLQEPNFIEFCVCGVDRAILSGCESPRRSSLQPAQVLDLFPVKDPTNPTPLVDTISDYCFPDGVMLDLVSTENNSKLAKDKYHILQFADATGKVTYACCLTITEVIEAPCDALIDNLSEIGALAVASNKIKHLFRKYVLQGRGLTSNRSKARFASSSSSSSNAHTPGNLDASSKDSFFAASTVKKQGGGGYGSTIMSGLRSLHKMAKGVSEKLTLEDASSSTMVEGSEQEESQQPPIIRNLFKRLGGHKSSSNNKDSKGDEAKSFNVNDAASGFFSDGNDSDCSVTSSDSEVPDDAAALEETNRKQKSQAKSLRTFSKGGEQASSTTTTNAVRPQLMTQRTFCILSVKPNHTLLFKILEAIANKERVCGNEKAGPNSAGVGSSSLLLALGATASKMRSISGADLGASLSQSSSSSSHVGSRGGGMERGRSESTTSNLSAISSASLYPSDAVGIACDVMLQGRKERRDKFLAHAMSISLTASGDGSVGGEETAAGIKVSFPSYVRSFRVENKTTTLEEWTTASLFCTIPAEVIVQILSMLLLEKSLVVVGFDAGLVTAISTAFVALLKPFRWEGIFVPLLPLNVREMLIQAPVPFVVGTTSPPRSCDVSSSAAVLIIDDYLDHKSATSHARTDGGLAFRRSRRRFLLVPTDGGAAGLTDPSKSPLGRDLVLTISTLATKLRLGPRGSNFSLRAASTQLVSFMLGMTNEEKRVVNQIMNAVVEHNTQLCGDIMEPAGWEKYGKLNPATKEFEFYPLWFIEPLRARLEFNEKVVHTQLFVSFMDRLRVEDEAKKRFRTFISDRIFFLYFVRRRRRKTEEGRL